MARNPRGRRPTDFKYSESLSDEVRFPDENTQDKNTRSFGGALLQHLDKLGSILAVSFLILGAASGYFARTLVEADKRSVVDLQAALRTTQLELKNVYESNARLTASLAAANATVKTLQDVDSAFADACASDPTISRLCKKSRTR